MQQTARDNRKQLESHTRFKNQPTTSLIQPRSVKIEAAGGRRSVPDAPGRTGLDAASPPR